MLDEGPKPESSGAEVRSSRRRLKPHKLMQAAITEEERNLLVGRAVSSGELYESIAARFGVSDTTVCSIAESVGVFPPSRAMGDIELTHDRLVQALDYTPGTGRFIWRDCLQSRNRNGSEAGAIADGYVHIHLDGNLYKAHRLAWFYVNGAWPEGDIDHRNGVGTDNRISNLRIATRQQNEANKGIRKNNTSGFRGVGYVAKAKLWRARMVISGKPIHLGYFKTAPEASAAYEQAQVERYGEFAFSKRSVG